MNTAHLVEIVRATQADSALLDNLLQLYIYDMSEMFPVKLDREGRFQYEKLPLYWSQLDSHHAFFICYSGEIVGFALVSRGSPASTDPAILDVNEFFILRSYRRLSLGRQAAFQLWKKLPGNWMVRVGERNQSALRFWEQTIRMYTGDRFSTIGFAGKTQPFVVHSFASEPRIGVAPP